MQLPKKSLDDGVDYPSGLCARPKDLSTQGKELWEFQRHMFVFALGRSTSSMDQTSFSPKPGRPLLEFPSDVPFDHKDQVSSLTGNC